MYVSNKKDTRDEKVFSTHNILLQNFVPVGIEEENITPSLVQNLADEVKKGGDIKSTIHFKTDKIAKVIPLLETGVIDYLVIDEAQFFPDLDLLIPIPDYIPVKIKVYGLLADFNRNRFGGMLDLIPGADNVIHLKAQCTDCAERGIDSEAVYSYLYNRPSVPSLPSSPPAGCEGEGEVCIVGGGDLYKALCRKCYLIQ